MTGADNFCLRLNDFGSNVNTYWKELQIDKDFCDVILASEEKQIKTHKIVISSCSPVLQNILKLNQHQQPLIYLRRVKHKDLQNLVTFMYQGEVNVAEEDLGSFLEAAEDLQIRGLSEINTEDFNSKQDEDESSRQQPHQTISSPKRSLSVRNESNNTSENMSMRHQNKSKRTYNNSIRDKNYSSDFKSSAESEIKPVRNINSKENNQNLVLATENKHIICDKCDKEFSRLDVLRSHIKIVHEKLTVTCDKCDKQFKSKSLWEHNSTVHEGVRFPCDYCNHKATKKQNLRRHKLSHHSNELMHIKQ